MGKRIATLIIEPRSLVRQGLVSLMASHSYHVIGGVGSAADIDSSLLVADVPRLVILGPLPAEEAAPAASCIRKLWPDTKIVLLFERAHRPIIRIGRRRRSTGAFHCRCRLMCLSALFNRFSTAISRSWSMRLHPVR